MKTAELLACCLLLFPLVGTAPKPVPNPRAKTLSFTKERTGKRAPLQAALRAGGEFFRAGRYPEAIKQFQIVSAASLTAGELDLAARATSNIGGCWFAQKQYRPALESFLEAHRLAERAGDKSAMAGLETNIASLYSEMGDLAGAAKWIEGAAERLSGEDRRRHLPALLLQLATVRSTQHRSREAFALFQQGIAGADCAGDVNLYTLGWNRLGEERLQENDLPGAEAALLEAFRVRKLNHLPLESSYRNLGRLRMLQGDLISAAALLDRAIEITEHRPGGMPAWDLYHSRGRVRLAQNRLPDALQDLRVALKLARAWRQSATTTDASRMGQEAMLDQLYAALIEAGNRLYLETHDRALIRETFEAAEENRASSLRAAVAAGPSSARLSERTQSALDGQTALFAFHLGRTASWLWALDRDGIELYALLPGERIEANSRTVSAAIREDSPDAATAGAELYRTLFGFVSPRLRRKSRWLLALDKAEHEPLKLPSPAPLYMFDLPLAALVETLAPGPVYLVERHSTELIPGAAYWLDAAARRAGAAPNPVFLGIGDPIYNAADPRLPAQPKPPSPFGLVAAAGPALPRLVSSAREVEECGRAWNGERVLLTGAQASRRNIEEALKRGPAVVHFATHFLESENRPPSALIALTLNGSGPAELLAPAAIEQWKIRAGLVVLSGCHSGQGGVLPATGELGLTRAWLMAGARAVVGSRWTTPDDSGYLFTALYRNLASHPGRGAAEALREGQLEMLRAGGWRARPRYWAAYFVVGNE